MRIVTGRQVRAARALAGMDQLDLARAAGVHRNAVAYWEARDSIKGPEPFAVRRIREALGREGVHVFSDPTPGVSLVPTVAA